MTTATDDLGLPPILTVDDFVSFTKMSKPTAARMRAEGTGPKVLRLGRSVRYRREDVLAWLDELSGNDAA